MTTALEGPRIYAFRRNLVVAASAGTGKTHSLVGVLVHLVLGASELGGEGIHEPIDPARIVATTFSRKAAAEIRTRLVQALERLAGGAADEHARAPYVADLATAMERGGRSAWSAREISDRARRALDGIGRAQIGTLHSFAATIARSYALELGLSPSFELADEDESRARAREGLERVVGATLDARDASIFALARAAGGAERLVEQLLRVLERLEEDGGSASALVIADGDSLEIEARLANVVEIARTLVGDAKLGDAARAVVDAKGDAAFAAAVVDLLTRRAGGKMSDDAAALFALREALPGGTHAERARLLLRSHASRHRFAELATSTRRLLMRCEDELRVGSRRASSLGFGEVLRAARDVLRDHPHTASDLAKALDVLLVDEFQDTSRLQRDLVQLVWEREPERRAPGALAKVGDVRRHGLFIVGDRKQSIYAFRGADVSVFAEVCVGLAGAPARDALGIAPGATWEPDEPLADFVPLRHNRRSEDEILAFANAYSARRLQPAREPPELYEISYVPETEDLHPPPERAPPSVPRARVRWLRVATEGATSKKMDEAFVIAERIQTLIAAGEPSVRGLPPRWKDVAVLAHTNAMLDATAFALAQAGVPYVVAGTGFWGAREVRDMVALLSWVVRPSDKLAMLAVLRGPWAGVRDETLIALTDPHAGLVDIGQWEEGERRALAHPDDRDALLRLRSVVSALRENADRLAPAALLHHAVRALDLEETLVQLPRGVQRVANVRKLEDIASRDVSARAFLERARDAWTREAKEAEGATFSEEDDAVRLLTVHGSKGLAFPIVFVPQVGNGGGRVEHAAFVLDVRADAPTRISTRIAEDDPDVLEPPSYERAIAAEHRRARAERARLAYVAATRAEVALYFVGDRKPPKSGATDAYQATAAAALADVAAVKDGAIEVEDVTPSRVLTPFAIPAPLHASAVPSFLPLTPVWRALPLATTALQDFAHCPRRFQLVHLLDLPEPERAPRSGSSPRVAGDDASRALPMASRDARDEGTLAHRLLEMLDGAAFGDARATEALSDLLEREGITRSDPRHADIVAPLARFATGAYARRVHESRAEIWRELPFVLEVPAAGGRALALRGAIDLLVAWPDGRIDVLDYKRSRGPSPEPYALQLDVYALAARQLYAAAPSVRTGIVFLGRDSGDPVWRSSPPADASRAAMSTLAVDLFDARWSERFPRVELPRCDAIHCAYRSLCHPSRVRAAEEAPSPLEASRAFPRDA